MGVNKEHKEFHAVDMSARLGNSGRLSRGHPAENPLRRTRRDQQARLAFASASFRARRLHDQAVRPRLLGRGLSDLGRSDGRQRRERRRRNGIRAKYLCLAAAGGLSRSLQVEERLHAVRNPLFRSGLTASPAASNGPRQNPASRSIWQSSARELLEDHVLANAFLGAGASKA